MRNKTIEQLQADVREHLEGKWDDLTIYERAVYISGVVDWSELLHEVFNTDYYITGRWEAEQWLGDCVYEVAAVIGDWEYETYAESVTDFSDPEAVVNVYTYIEGEEAIRELAERYELKVA